MVVFIIVGVVPIANLVDIGGRLEGLIIVLVVVLEFGMFPLT
jgi:hypothetical protein